MLVRSFCHVNVAVRFRPCEYRLFAFTCSESYLLSPSGHAERRDVAELRERPQALRHRVRAGIAGVRQLVEAARRGRAESRRDVSNVRSAALLRSRPNDRSRSSLIALRLIRLLAVNPLPRLPTYATSTTRSRVISRCSEMLHWFSLRHLAGVGMNPLRRRVHLAGRRPDARVVGDPEQIVAVVHQSGAQQGARLAEGRRLEVDRVPPARAERRTAVGLAEAGLRVGDAPSAAKHGLRVDLIGRADARPERVGIGLDETAVARARPLAFVDRRAEQAAGRRIRHVGREHAAAILLFVAVRLSIPSQAVVERQRTFDAPRVLQEHRHRRLPPVRIGRIRHGGVVHHPEQEARVRQSDGAAAEILPVGRRQGRLLRVERVLSRASR